MEFHANFAFYYVHVFVMQAPAIAVRLSASFFFEFFRVSRADNQPFKRCLSLTA
jgi:hypothetical protein